ncbi:MAG: ribonuclease P [Desulfurococcales archaeon]|nr:ribonuclease P [Desulfurococcales archaeon]
MRGSKDRRVVKDLAVQRSLLLYSEAVRAVKEGREELARKYVELGLRLLRKGNVRKPMVYRRWVCKKCGIPLVPGVTASVRIKGNRKQIIVVKKCLICGWVSRTPCKRKKGVNPQQT